MTCPRLLIGTNAMFESEYWTRQLGWHPVPQSRFLRRHHAMRRGGITVQFAYPDQADLSLPRCSNSQTSDVFCRGPELHTYFVGNCCQVFFNKIRNNPALHPEPAAFLRRFCVVRVSSASLVRRAATTPCGRKCTRQISSSTSRPARRSLSNQVGCVA